MDTNYTISELILNNKVKVIFKRAIIEILYEWHQCSHLWKWAKSTRNKGIDGFPVGLITGIEYLDSLLSGSAFIEYPLYTKYEHKRWGVDEIVRAIQQLNLAASDARYHPYDPTRKKYLQRLTLDKFFWNGFIKGEPQPYTHAPFLFFFETGAVLNEDMIERLVPTNTYLYDQLLAYLHHINNVPSYVEFSTKEHNRFVAFIDKLAMWHNEHAIQLVHNNIDVIVDAAKTYFTTWKKPISVQAFASNKAYEDILKHLSLLETITNNTTIQYELNPLISQYNGATILQDIEEDKIGAFCSYCAQNGVLVDKATLNYSLLLEHDQLALRQLVRRYKAGEFTIVQQTVQQDWRALAGRLR